MFTPIVGETLRAYLYADGAELAIQNVTALAVSKSGGHRLETALGAKYYIAPGWLAINIVAENWSC